MGKSLIVFLAATYCCSAVVLGSVISNFDSDADGWRVADLPQSLGNPPSVVQYVNLDWSASGGNPFGYVHREDPGDNWFWFAAPSKFLGNQSGAYGNTLAFNLACTGDDGVPYPGVILATGSFALYRTLSPPGTTFSNYVVPLSESGWHVGTASGPNATAAQMQQVLGTLNALYINADWQSGFETTSLDNVVLVPEPLSASLLLIACCWVAISQQTRRSNDG